jgi:hypothetical protein
MCCRYCYVFNLQHSLDFPGFYHSGFPVSGLSLILICSICIADVRSAELTARSRNFLVTLCSRDFRQIISIELPCYGSYLDLGSLTSKVRLTVTFGTSESLIFLA